MSRSILDKLESLYGPEKGLQCYQELVRQMEDFQASHPPPTLMEPNDLTEQDSILIAYGDMIRQPGSMSLATLEEFLSGHLSEVISGVHVLPFFPSSSDDGFSVIDYRKVDPTLGTWEDVERLARRFDLMVDLVVNHVSAQSKWFVGFIQGDEQYREYFITVDPSIDLSMVVRPRALPLLTPFQTAWGEQHVWTTFSADQIDLNYASPAVLRQMIDVLLFYIARGARFVRLDAIAYLWKEIGTPCIHLPQTHRIVQLFRAVLDMVAPHVKLITETNVPHSENIAYFGDGHNEAHLVYNFALPPLVLHTFLAGNARILSEWVADLRPPSDHATFLNFLASHDGIGLNAAHHILPERDINVLVEQALAHGGLISYKHNPDGSRSPYELNINYFDALTAPDSSEPTSIQVNRFIAAQAIMLAMMGVPGIYFHSLVGSRGWPEGVQRTGHNRAINREKLDYTRLVRDLADPGSLRYQIFRRYLRLLKARRTSPAFAPTGLQKVLDCGKAVFGLARRARMDGETVYCLHNVSPERQTVILPKHIDRAENLLTDDFLSDVSMIELAPYEVCWLRPVGHLHG